ncbi:MarR family winged helix-turn-helix transcriptional regulator [Aliiroseovarius lamellibrachiae]|uniref:MarR family winged helix-turn-helix transcriptional regulator n=1 Tax=Aliiroseovarius lamellibrachiae TaxID=1924933 RepID=UPI001BE0BC28|nr:MarR family winged helix-turn-helix transcriptional regulator [Aliiroseovarius lamellibrachiae]MBT2130412.1 MarR family winged helix-turn-helix transcriptional regulator [Aliiroseovarius lamellibrachiae]
MTPPNPNEDTTAIWVLLNLVNRHVVGRFETELKRAGLPNTRWYDVLWALERQNCEGLRQFQLEELSLFDQPNLSRILKRMVEQGLVTQCAAENDGRGRVLRITDSGRELRTQMWAVYGGLMLSEIEEKVAPEHLEGLKNGLRDLLPEEWATSI